MVSTMGVSIDSLVGGPAVRRSGYAGRSRLPRFWLGVGGRSGSVLLVCQTVRLVCYRETDALAPMVTAGFAVIIWLVALTRRNRDS